MFGHLHPLSQKSASGKIIAGLNFFQLIVVLAGAKMSYDFSGIVPALPFKNFIIAHIHHMVPLILSAIGVLVRESKTGLPIAVYLYSWLFFVLRRKTFIWRRR